jgi:DNA repair protein RadD
VFTSGVKHAEDVVGILEELTGERVGLVTGETLPIERSGILAGFKGGSLRWLVNCDVLTTGFNAKCVDAIAIMRATMSPGLFCQMVGRGLRLHPGKQNCFVLDYGGNIARHGSLDDRNFGRASEEKRGQAARAAALNGRGKPCPACGLDVPANSRECECGFIFPVNHQGSADASSQLTGQMPPEVWTVVSASAGKHTKRNDPDAPPTLRIDYECQPVDSEGGLLTTKISEWICLEHPPGNFARLKAVGWWQCRSLAPAPDTVEEAVSLINRGAVRMSSQITTTKDGKYFRIQSCEFADEIPDEWEEEIEEEEPRIYSGEGLDVPF